MCRFFNENFDRIEIGNGFPNEIAEEVPVE